MRTFFNAFRRNTKPAPLAVAYPEPFPVGVKFIIDADDFHQSNNGLEILFYIKSQAPDFRINLFTIPGLCNEAFLREVRKLDWIDMIPHGWLHPTPLECLEWSYERSKEYLKQIEPFGFTKGFRAPGWQISDGMYRALLEEGYWVADQTYNNLRRPPELPFYLLDAPGKLHFHIGGRNNNNQIGMFAERLCKLQGQFEFIKDNIQYSK